MHGIRMDLFIYLGLLRWRLFWFFDFNFSSPVWLRHLKVLSFSSSSTCLARCSRDELTSSSPSRRLTTDNEAKLCGVLRAPFLWSSDLHLMYCFSHCARLCFWNGCLGLKSFKSPKGQHYLQCSWSELSKAEGDVDFLKLGWL